MKKRKIIATALCLSVFAGAAIASGSDTEETKSIVAGEKESEDKDSGSESESDETTTEAKQDITIDEQEIINQSDIVITAKEYVTDSIWGDGIKLNIQNNSDDNITVGCTALIVNNYMINDLFACEVAAGMQANDTVYLSSNELEAAGIDNVGQVEIYFHVYNSDTWDNIFDSDCVTIQTSAYDDMDISACDDGVELYNEDGIKIVGKTVDENSFWGTAILLYIENNSGKNVGISAENMSINGFMVTPFFSATVYDGKMCVDDITIMSSDLENNGIESIEEVQLSFHIYNADTYASITDTDVITFSAN